VWAIVVAAGEGRRFGGPKQYALLDGSTVLARSVRAARHVAEGVIAVVPPTRVCDPSAGEGADSTVAGGATRSESVRAGLAKVPVGTEIVLVHDAARPLASVELFHSVIDAIVDGADGAVPGIAVTDTIKQVRDGVVVATLDRTTLVAVQTPQAFTAASLRAAHDSGAEATDDAALLERTGHRVVVVAGEATNIKITDSGDLDLAARLLSDRSAAIS
jgi:2-C-methyl-D-erythritol 4-phosphate cytidylyltransferase